MWGKPGNWAASHNTHFLPRVESSTGLFIQLSIGGGKATMERSR
jgi:hypothetical protein